MKKLLILLVVPLMLACELQELIISAWDARIGYVANSSMVLATSTPVKYKDEYLEMIP